VNIHGDESGGDTVTQNIPGVAALSSFGINAPSYWTYRVTWSTTDPGAGDWVAIQRWPASGSGDEVQLALNDIKWCRYDEGEYREEVPWTGWVGAIAWRSHDLGGQNVKSVATSAAYVELTRPSASWADIGHTLTATYAGGVLSLAVSYDETFTGDFARGYLEILEGTNVLYSSYFDAGAGRVIDGPTGWQSNTGITYTSKMWFEDKYGNRTTTDTDTDTT
jgi:hypothetical protein